ncbi:DUF1206 domain-containing protein [Peterkaempfera griseoplana]|uniref:DUF1206 domain-containing protein n=1 Tax=Peterkaempfera griseoplana TaxID=66896 RepID=UPI00099F3EBF|nr:DUF1206 domain-containing protein [Peterkaempfera griseoplana]
MTSSHVSSGTVRPGGRRNRASVHGLHRRDAFRTAGRAGFVARGAVYALIGALAVEIALGRSGAQADRQGALHQVAAQPFGLVMLWTLAAGFAGMALWRTSLAIGAGGGPKKTGSRVLNAARAVFYAFVCWGTAAYAAGSGGQSGSDAASQDWTAGALRLPAGQFLVAGAGIALAAIGSGIVVRAAQRRFLRKLDTAAMGRRTRDVVTVLGLGGNSARGVTYALAGVFVLVAAIRYDPHQAKGMDATLRSFAQTPAGPWLLIAVAVGLVLFGGFSFASARWRNL